MPLNITIIHCLIKKAEGNSKKVLKELDKPTPREPRWLFPSCCPAPSWPCPRLYPDRPVCGCVRLCFGPSCRYGQLLAPQGLGSCEESIICIPKAELFYCWINMKKFEIFEWFMKYWKQNWKLYVTFGAAIQYQSKNVLPIVNYPNKLSITMVGGR